MTVDPQKQKSHKTWTLRLCSWLMLLIGILFYLPIEASSTPVFIITPIIKFPTEMLVNTTAVAEYTVTNNTSFSWNSIGLDFAASAMTQITTGAGVCGDTFSLTPGASCTLKLSLEAATPLTIDQGPVICYTKANPVFCSQPTPGNRIDVKIVNQSGNLVTLSDDGPLILLRGVPVPLTVTNTSATTEANNVQLSLDNIQNDIQLPVTNTCQQIAPLGNCTITVTAKLAALELNFPQQETLQGSNTEASTVDVQLVTEPLTATPLAFSTSGNDTMTLTNLSPLPITITSVSVLAGINGVTFSGPVPAACQPIAVLGGTCQLTFTATNQAHGSSQATIDYTVGGANQSLNANLSVDNTTISVNSGNEIQLKRTEANQVFTINNTGNFAWQNPDASLNAMLTNVTFTNNCNATVLVGGSCTVSFDTTGATIGDNTILNVTGDNIDTNQTQVVIDEGVVIEQDTQASNRHLRYRALRIENLRPNTSNVQLASVPTIGSNLANRISFCAAGDTSCAEQSTCQVGVNIPSETSCLIWLRADSDDTIALGDITDTVTISVDNDGTPENAVFNFTYGQDLYAGGRFSTAGGQAASAIAMWDGSSWSALSSGVNNRVFSLSSDGEDLLAGGNFTSAGGNAANRVAVWDGTEWAVLGPGIAGGNVRSIIMFDNAITTGGNFINAGGNANADRVAKLNAAGNAWEAFATGLNGQVITLFDFGGVLVAGGQFTNFIAEFVAGTWTTIDGGLPNRVYTLSSFGNELIAGGTFTNAGGDVNADRIARFNGTNWVALNSGGLSSTVWTMLPFNNGAELIIGGNFINAGGNPSADRIVEYDGTQWLPLGTGVNSSVRALTAHGSTLYVGGQFTTAGGLGANRIAAFASGTWSALGTGMNERVFALIVLPSIKMITN